MTEQTDAAEVEDGLFSLWRDAAEKNVRHGIDWPRIVRRLFRALDEAAAREAATEARGAERALREAADEFEAEDEAGRIVGRLRALAAQVAPSRVPGEGS